MFALCVFVFVFGVGVGMVVGVVVGALRCEGQWRNILVHSVHAVLRNFGVRRVQVSANKESYDGDGCADRRPTSRAPFALVLLMSP